MRNISQRIAGILRRDGKDDFAEEAARPRTKAVAVAKKPSVALHPVFVALLTLWGAAVSGLSAFVAPDSFIAAVARSLQLPSLGSLSAPAAWLIFAVAGGVLAFAIARIWRAAAFKRTGKVGEPEALSRSVDPIDPASDLGSDSLDAPLEQFNEEELDETFEEFISEPDADALDLEDNQLYEAIFADENSPLVAKPAARRDTSDYDMVSSSESPDVEADIPAEMGLSEFAELPGRNAVWVEPELAAIEADLSSDEDASDLSASSVAASDSPNPAFEPTTDFAPETPCEPQVDDTKPLAAIRPTAPSALARLRQTPPAELSMVQLVERFAAALHDRQNSVSAHASLEQARSKDAALAEALKALDMFRGQGFDQLAGQAGDQTGASSELQDTTRELREALAKLQTLSGAA